MANTVKDRMRDGPQDSGRGTASRLQPATKCAGPSVRVLTRALEELIRQHVLPRHRLMDCLGQLCVWLRQAQQVSALQDDRLPSIRARKNRLNLDRPWDWFSLYHDEQTRAGVLTVHPYRPLPPHDHGGAGGLLLVLEGHIIEHRYTVDAADRQQGTIRLTHEEARYLGPGQFTVHDALESRAHSLSTAGRPAKALSVQYLHSGAICHNWYLPVEEQREGNGVRRVSCETICRRAC